MSHYERSTTAMTLATLPEPLRGAIAEEAEALHLTVADDARAFLTHSRQLKKKGGLFGRMAGLGDPDGEHLTAMVIGAKDLLVARYGEQAGTQVFAARLVDVDTRSGISAESYAAAGIPAGDGMSVNGFRRGGDIVSFYVGLGAPEGDSARDALEAAVRAAKA
jgi:hypothetical protein